MARACMASTSYFFGIANMSARTWQREESVDPAHVDRCYCCSPTKHCSNTMNHHIVKVAQLIKCKASDAFDGFVDPDKLTQFWLDSASGPLSQGATVTWHFMVPGAVDSVTVTRFERPSLLEFTWSSGAKTRLEFSQLAPDATKVSVFAHVSSDADLIEQVVGTTEGFTIVLCDLKTFLESGRSANLVRAKAELIAASIAAPPGDI